MDAALTNSVYSFILIVIRFSGLFLTTPLFSTELIPNQVKIGFSVLCGIILFPVVFANGLVVFPDYPIEVVFQVTNELLVGVVLGFVAMLTFAAFQMAGQLIDLSTGFSMVNVIDPFFGEDMPLMGQFKNLLAMMVLLAINGHHEILRALIKSFQLIPVTKPILNGPLIDYVFRLSGDLFLIGLRISLPIVATLFIIDFVFGFIARTAPQMNIFVLGFPIKIMIGFALIFLSLPFMIDLMTVIIHTMNQQVYDVLKLFK